MKAEAKIPPSQLLLRKNIILVWPPDLISSFYNFKIFLTMGVLFLQNLSRTGKKYSKLFTFPAVHSWLSVSTYLLFQNLLWLNMIFFTLEHNSKSILNWYGYNTPDYRIVYRDRPKMASSFGATFYDLFPVLQSFTRFAHQTYFSSYDCEVVAIFMVLNFEYQSNLTIYSYTHNQLLIAWGFLSVLFSITEPLYNSDISLTILNVSFTQIVYPLPLRRS